MTTKTHLKTPEEIDDATAEKIGAALAKVLQLRKSKEHKDRWETSCGDKTNIGLYRTVYNVLENPEKFVD